MKNHLLYNRLRNITSDNLVSVLCSLQATEFLWISAFKRMTIV